jgi:hypothetical protein
MIQQKMNESSRLELKRSKGLAETRAEEKKDERTTKNVRAADDARHDPRTVLLKRRGREM